MKYYPHFTEHVGLKQYIKDKNILSGFQVFAYLVLLWPNFSKYGSVL